MCVPAGATISLSLYSMYSSHLFSLQGWLPYRKYIQHAVLSKPKYVYISNLENMPDKTKNNV